METDSGIARAEPPPVKDPRLAAAYRRKQKSSLTLPAILLLIVFAVGALFYGVLTLIALVGVVLSLFGGSGVNPSATQAQLDFVKGENLHQLAVIQDGPFGPPAKTESETKDAPPSKPTRSPSLGLSLLVLLVYGMLLLINLALCLAAYLTKRHESYAIAMVTCIAALLPISVLWCVSLPVGIWGLVALHSRDVKLLFHK